MNVKKMAIEQLDERLKALQSIPIGVPPKGWIRTIRRAIGMSLRQLGSRLDITAQSASEIEDREASGSITLRALREVAESMNLRLVYGFVPINGTLQKMIEEQALLVAREIVMRTDQSMLLEAQQNDQGRIEKSIQERARQIAESQPRYLWDQS